MYEISMQHARADRALRNIIARELEQFKVSMMEWLLLGVVVGGPDKGMSMSSIAASLDVTMPQVSALVGNLIDQKLVKQKALKEDRRTRVVTPTARGKVLLKDMEQATNAALKNSQSKISADDWMAYQRTLTQLAEVVSYVAE